MLVEAYTGGDYHNIAVSVFCACYLAYMGLGTCMNLSKKQKEASVDSRRGSKKKKASCAVRIGDKLPCTDYFQC